MKDLNFIKKNLKLKILMQNLNINNFKRDYKYMIIALFNCFYFMILF